MSGPPTGISVQARKLPIQLLVRPAVVVHIDDTPAGRAPWGRPVLFPATPGWHRVTVFAADATWQRPYGHAGLDVHVTEGQVVPLRYRLPWKPGTLTGSLTAVTG